ncbi:MAG: topoisomerase [Opitutae bacterium]|nr:topoisomerase [Opitutae bacterium]|tara:strand:+ start:4843 stop:6333 length:1491 start_codon:yes stop_codon:yes gene_type:complete
MEKTTPPPTTQTSFVSGRYSDLNRRNLTEKTCKKWGYQLAEVDGEQAQVANYRSRDGKLVGQKIRFANKDFKVRGELVGLYGQHLWRDGGRRVVVTEGEIDALSVSQAFEHKWPVVSIPHGAQSGKNHVAQALDWLERFEEVVFMFDMDESGRKGATECAALLTPGRAKIAELPLKDPNDMVVANRTKELVDAVWQARDYRPDGIVGADELWDKINEVNNAESQPYPYEILNNMTHGIRRGELVTVCAGSGIGKSLFCREIAYSLLQAGETVGYIALEESVRRTALGIMGLHVGKQLHLQKEIEPEALRPTFEETVGNGKFFTYDHFGSCDSDNLLNRIRYLCKGLNCKWIFLDHLSIVVSGFDGDDERRLIDNTMTRLRSLVEETQCGMVLVSHLKRPPGNGHEEGAVTSLAHLRGSHAIPQLSDMVIGLERNQQSDSDANQTRLRVLKNRFSGESGLAGTLYFNNTTGRLDEKDTTMFKNDSDNNQTMDTDHPF